MESPFTPSNARIVSVMESLFTAFGPSTSAEGWVGWTDLFPLKP